MPSLTSSRKRKWDIPARPDLCRRVDDNRFRPLPALIRQAPYHHYLGEGSYRTVYVVDAQWVLKFPRNAAGERDNIIEALLYQHDPRYRARCELVEFHGVWALKMERLDRLENKWDTDAMPRHLRWTVGRDGNQCGYRPGTSELVAYDYAYVAKSNREARHTFQWILKHYGRY
jgi:hypothetical protein